MLGLLRDMVNGVAEVGGMLCGVALAPIAFALGVTQEAVERAVRAGCRTEAEVERWLRSNG